MVQDDFKLEFLYQELNWLDDRRNAIDMRATVVLAVCSFAIGSLFSQWKVGEFLYSPNSDFMKSIYLTNIIIFIISLLESLSLIAPINRTLKLRKEVYKNKKLYRTLTFFYDIAKFETDNSYYELLEAKSNEELKMELSKQIVQISKLLRFRYLRLQSACDFLNIGLFLLMFFVVLKFFYHEH